MPLFIISASRLSLIKNELFFSTSAFNFSIASITLFVYHCPRHIFISSRSSPGLSEFEDRISVSSFQLKVPESVCRRIQRLFAAETAFIILEGTIL